MPWPPLRAWQAADPPGVPSCGSGGSGDRAPVPQAPSQPVPRAGGLPGEPRGTAFQTGLPEVAVVSLQHNIALTLGTPGNLCPSCGFVLLADTGLSQPRELPISEPPPEGPVPILRCLPAPEAAFFLQDVVRLQQAIREQPTASQVNTELEKKGPNAKVIPAEERMST